MNNIKTIICAIVVIIAVALIFASGYHFASKDNSYVPEDESKETVYVPDGDYEYSIELELKELSDLQVYYSQYNVSISKENQKSIFEKINVPFTKKTITLTAQGILKVGCDLSEIKVSVEKKKLVISLPEMEILDNYIDIETIKCEEDDNYLNPIEFEDYQYLLTEMEKQGAANSVESGIYQKAEKRMQKLIEKYLEKYSDYNVVFE